MKDNTLNNRIRLVREMNDIIVHLNNEQAYMRWIYVVPDEATEEDFEQIAKDEGLFTMAYASFCRQVKAYGKYGLYDGENLVGDIQ